MLHDREQNGIIMTFFWSCLTLPSCLRSWSSTDSFICLSSYSVALCIITIIIIIIIITIINITAGLVHKLMALSVLVGIFPSEPGLSVFIEDKDDGGGGDNRSCKTCKAPVKSSPPTNQHPVFYRPDALPVAKFRRKPAMSEHRRKNITFQGLAHRKLIWEFANFVFDH